MKPWLLLTLLLSTLTASAADQILAGPKGGRLLQVAPLQAEFFVTPERKAEINFYSDQKPVAPTTQTVALTAEPQGKRLPIALEKTSTGFISRDPLPESAEPYRIVLQIRPTPDAKPVNFRIDLNLTVCAECDKSEYACTCVGH